MNVSVIIPTRNRPRLLREALRSVCDQEFTGAAEIIVVDNGSAEDLSGIVRAADRESPHAVRLVHENVPGLLSGRHRGFIEAKAEILVFIDDDIQAAPGWLQGIASAFSDQSVSLVGGPSLPLYEVDPPKWATELWATDRHGRSCAWFSLIDFGPTAKIVDPNFVWGLNFAIRRSTLIELKGFHPDNVPSELQRFQGDGETGLTKKAAQRGYAAIYEPRALVHHFIPAERLTVSFFKSRAFYQGVADSYSRIRQDGSVDRFLRWRFAFRKGLSLFFPRQRHLPVPRRFGRQLGKAYWDGFLFHYREASRDPAVLEWVLRPDYWDYGLPVS